MELTVALHHVFNTPDDRIIWDVGHQVMIFYFFNPFLQPDPDPDDVIYVSGLWAQNSDGKKVENAQYKKDVRISGFS